MGDGNGDGRLDELLPAMDLIDDPEILRHLFSISIRLPEIGDMLVDCRKL